MQTVQIGNAEAEDQVRRQTVQTANEYIERDYTNLMETEQLYTDGFLHLVLFWDLMIIAFMDSVDQN